MVVSQVIIRAGLAVWVTGTVVPLTTQRAVVGVAAGIEGRRELSPVIFWRVNLGEK